MEEDKELNQQLDQMSYDSDSDSEWELENQYQDKQDKRKKKKEQQKEEEDDNDGPRDVRNSPYDKIYGKNRKYRSILQNSYIFPELFNKEFCKVFHIPQDQIDF